MTGGCLPVERDAPPVGFVVPVSDTDDAIVAGLDREKATLRNVVTAALASGLKQLLEHEPGVRLGGDPEDVHQARVAARRLRSDLRTFRDLLDDHRIGPLREELRWLGAELGTVRNADILLQRLRPQVSSLPAADQRAGGGLLRRLEAERAAAGSGLVAALDSDRYGALVEALTRVSGHPPLRAAADASARRALPGLVRTPWRHLATAVDRLGKHPDDDALHLIRIRVKRVRYAAEAAAPVVGKPAKRFARAMADVQSVLGDLQDAVMAEGWLRGAGTRGSPAQALVAGELIGVQRQAMVASRHDWKSTWEGSSSKRLRAWLA
ncbi:MAG: CHAD domain-containing protein [Actinomycetota bacterium]